MMALKDWVEETEDFFVSKEKNDFGMVFVAQSGTNRYTPILEKKMKSDYDYQFSRERRFNQKILKRGFLTKKQARAVIIDYMKKHTR